MDPMLMLDDDDPMLGFMAPYPDRKGYREMFYSLSSARPLSAEVLAQVRSAGSASEAAAIWWTALLAEHVPGFDEVRMPVSHFLRTHYPLHRFVPHRSVGIREAYKKELIKALNAAISARPAEPALLFTAALNTGDDSDNFELSPIILKVLRALGAQPMGMFGGMQGQFSLWGTHVSWLPNTIVEVTPTQVRASSGGPDYPMTVVWTA